MTQVEQTPWTQFLPWIGTPDLFDWQWSTLNSTPSNIPKSALSGSLTHELTSSVNCLCLVLQMLSLLWWWCYINSDYFTWFSVAVIGVSWPIWSQHLKNWMGSWTRKVAQPRQAPSSVNRISLKVVIWIIGSVTKSSVDDLASYLWMSWPVIWGLFDDMPVIYGLLDGLASYLLAVGWSG